MRTKFFVVTAPGYCGDKARVVSSHVDLKQALESATWDGLVVREGDLRKGDDLLRVDFPSYPIVGNPKP